MSQPACRSNHQYTRPLVTRRMRPSTTLWTSFWTRDTKKSKLTTVQVLRKIVLVSAQAKTFLTPDTTLYGLLSEGVHFQKKLRFAGTFRRSLILPEILAFHSNQNGVSYYRNLTTVGSLSIFHITWLTNMKFWILDVLTKQITLQREYRQETI